MGRKDMSAATRKAIERAEIRNYTVVGKKYSRRKKKQIISFVRGYDLLQYIIAVRPYIEKKHGIDQLTLEYLLYLFPIQYFTRKDYRLIPKYRDYYVSLNTLIEQGWIHLAIKRRASADVFGFTEAGRACVQEFYQYLAGEKTISIKPIDSNPFADPDDKVLDNMRWELMLKMRGEAERRPSIFRKALFQKVPPLETSMQESELDAQVSS